MALNYRILNIDIYEDLRKPELYQLAKEYNLIVPDDIQTTRSRHLRKILATTKLAHKQAYKNPLAEQILKRVLNKQPLTETQQTQFPDIQQFALLTQSLYDIAEFDEEKPDYINVQTEDALNSPVPHQIPRPIVDHAYEELNFNRPTTTNSPQVHLPPDTQTRIETPLVNNKNENNSTNNMSTERRPLVRATAYSGLESEDPELFLDKFEIAAKINAWSDDTKLDLFETHLTNLPYKWLKIYKHENKDNLNWNDLKKEFLRTFSPIAQIDDVESVLENRLQQENESLTKFLFEITFLCKKVDNNMPEKKIVAYVINGSLPKFCKELIRLENASLAALRENCEKLDKQLYMENKNSKRFKVRFDIKQEDTSIAKHNVEPKLELEDRLTQIEHTIANMTLKPKEGRSSRDSSNESGKYDRRQSPRRNSIDRDQRTQFEQNGRTNSRWHRFQGIRRQTNEGNGNYNAEGYHPQYNRSHYKNNWGYRNGERNNAYGTNSNEGRRYSSGKYCAICHKNNHDTTTCHFNLKIKKTPLRNGGRRQCEICFRTNHSTENCFYNAKTKNE